MNEQEALNLLRRYNANECTAEEIAVVESYFIHQLQTAEAPEVLENKDVIKQEIWAAVMKKPVERRIPVYYRYAAIITAILGITSVVYYYTTTQHKTAITKTIVKDIQPGGNSATLTLANGKEISLDSLNGKIATGPSGALVSNNSGNGVITYQLTNSNVHKDVRVKMYPDEVNTINIPKGGQYQLVLADGTRVFLNSDSKLRYPVYFTAGERKVFLSGEGYFQVAKDAKRPFLVITEGQQLKVLGTHFNVSAYPNETVKTTLAEGSVELTSSSSLKKQHLKPEQQALLVGESFQVHPVNSDDEMAWKDGLFIFRKMPVAEVLRKLSRWYNVEADFSDLPNTTFTADLLRTATLQEVITALNFSNRSKGIKIQLIDGRRLIISKTK